MLLSILAYCLQYWFCVPVVEHYSVSQPCLTSLFSPQSEKNAFFVADLGVVMRQQVRWRTHLPQIRPYFPVRCNNSPTVIEVLAAFGSGFVCANKVWTHGIDCFHQNSHEGWKKSICWICLMLHESWRPFHTERVKCRVALSLRSHSLCMVDVARQMVSKRCWVCRDIKKLLEFWTAHYTFCSHECKLWSFFFLSSSFLFLDRSHNFLVCHVEFLNFS